jgi:2-dehydro-3-deoxygalactonokinase
MNELFFSCDWGTSAFRLRLIDAASLTSLSESYSDEGVASVYAKWQQDNGKTDRVLFYRAVLQRHIETIAASVSHALGKLPIVVSGMASSTIGIKELPYKHLPFSLSGFDLDYEIINGTEHFTNPLVLVSGARTEHDVMRGEETQLAGCAQQGNNGQQVYVFPGTHSKHVYVQNGYAVAFETYMTGEFFQLLSQNSILAQSVFAGIDIEVQENKAAFEQGVLDSQHHHVLHAAFMVRTNQLFQRFSKKENYWYLSGLLIGSELAVLLQKMNPAITIVADGSIAQSYRSAFKALGMEVGVLGVTVALVTAHAGILKRAIN